MKQLNWYQIFGQTHTIPDGRTVTPTDDIQIWLNCADIWDKTYTTLAEVLADTDTLSALIASSNAVDYMVRSTTWAVRVSVPTMTSNTAPKGQCLYSGQNSGQEAYKAFDRNDSSFWNSGSASVPQYVGYKFTESSPIFYAKVKFASYNTLSVVKIQKSDDGVTWEDASDETNVPGTTETIISVDGSSHAYWRMYIISQSRTSTYVGVTVALDFYTTSLCDNSTAMSYIGLNNYCANTLLADSTWCNAICNSEYFESVLNVKVPKMTSNTTPEGEVIFDSTNGSYPPYQGFDGNDNTMCATANDSPTLHYFGYAFVESVKVYFVEWIPRADRKTRTKVRASADGLTWIDKTDFIDDSLTAKQRYSTVLENSSTYRYWCCQGNVTDGSGYGMNYYTIQFYGRKDV